MNDQLQGTCSKFRVWIAMGVLALGGSAIAATPDCKTNKIDMGGYHLWVDLQGSGATTVVFESGAGDDSTVWSAITPRIRALGVRTFVYDRAGLGQSELRPGPYSIETEANALTRALDLCTVNGPIIVVSHSYGGFIALLMAERDKRVAGLVEVDANVPDFFSSRELDIILSTYRPQYDAIRAQAPALAKVMIPMMEAYPASAKRLRKVKLPAALPVIDIVAEKSWALTPESAVAMRKAHADFVLASSGRTAVFAAGSSHKVMQDKPDLVVDAIGQLVRKVAPH